MSDTTNADSPESQRTLAVRINGRLRDQLDVLAQLSDRTVTEEIRHAIEAWIEAQKANPKILARAESVRADIERDAINRQNAIEAIFAKAGPRTPPRRPAGKD